MYIEKRFIVPLSLILLVVGLVTLLAVVGMTFWLGNRTNEHFDGVIRSRDVRVAAVEMRSAVQSAEASQRGLLLTGNQIYLSPYDAAKATANRQLDNLRRNLDGDPQFQAVLQRLTAIIAEKFAEMDKTIELKNNRKDDEAFAIFNTNRGKALMDEVNLFVSGIVRAMDNRLTSGVVQQRANAANLRFASIVASLLIVLVVGAVAATLLQYTKELAGARDEVSALNVSLEDRVRRRTEDLARANEEMQRFTHLVSHDIRAPLISIVGFAGELAEGTKSLREYFDRFGGRENDPGLQQVKRITNEEMPEAISFIRKSTDKMETLLNAVLKLSREGRRDPRPEFVDLKEIVLSNASAIHHQLSEANGRIDTKIEVGSVVTDRLSLEQVIGNLFDNAVKYRAKERPLRLQVSSFALPDGQIAIEVADNGRGVAPHDVSRIFELFRRVGKLDQTGEGVGLAYARTVVRNVGGDITATSELDKGTTFRIVLPRELALNSSTIGSVLVPMALTYSVHCPYSLHNFRTAFQCAGTGRPAAITVPRVFPPFHRNVARCDTPPSLNRARGLCRDRWSQVHQRASARLPWPQSIVAWPFRVYCEHRRRQDDRSKSRSSICISGGLVVCPCSPLGLTGPGSVVQLFVKGPMLAPWSLRRPLLC